MSDPLARFPSEKIASVFIRERPEEAIADPTLSALAGMAALGPLAGATQAISQAVLAGIGQSGGSVFSRQMEGMSGLQKLEDLLEPGLENKVKRPTSKILGLLNLEEPVGRRTKSQVEFSSRVHGGTLRVRDLPDFKTQMNLHTKVDQMKDVVDSFIDKHKLPEKGVTMSMRSGPLSFLAREYYDPKRKEIRIGKLNEPILLHELGHAADFTGSTTGKIRAKLGPAIKRIGFAAVPLALVVGDRMKETIPGSIDDKVISFVQDHAPEIIGATLAATTLYPEAKASALALKHIKEVKPEAFIPALKKLAPLFGTYLLGAIPAIVGASLGRKWLERARAEKGELKKEGGLKLLKGLGQTLRQIADSVVVDVPLVAAQIGTEFSELMKRPDKWPVIRRAAKEFATDPETLMTGALHGVPAGIAAYYLLNTKGGEIIHEVGKKHVPKRTTFQVEKPLPRGVGLNIKPGDSTFRDNAALYAGVVALGSALSASLLGRVRSDIYRVL